MGGRGRAVMPGDKHCRICLQTVTAKRYRTLYHEDIVPLHRHIRSVVGPIRKDDVDGMSNFEFLCNLCCTKVKQLEVAHIKIRKIQRFIESNLDALTAIHESARQKLFTVKIAPTQTSETMNSIGHEDMLQPGKQYTIMYLSKRIKLESDMPDDSDSNSCTARRWVVAENGMLTEVSTLDTNISMKNSTLPINKERGDEDVIRSEVNETNRTEEVGTEQKGSTDIVPTEQWRGMITNEVNKTYGTEEICTVGEGMTDTVFVEECHDVVVKTEVIQSDRTEDVGTVQERSTNIVPTEECCDVVNKSEVIQCDRTEHIGTIGTMQERTTNIVPTEECCDVVNKSEVVQCDRTEHIGTMQERTTNIVPTEDCYDVVKVTETLKATDKTQSTASLLATSADIPVKLRSTRRPSVLKCSVCSKMFGRVRCLKVHERLHMQLKSYSRRSMIVERENVDV